MSENNKAFTRHDIFGSSYVNGEGQITNLYRRCPHCGLVDYHYSVQGLKNSHFPITCVGSLRKYECGKCRKQFHTFEVCIPANTDPMEFYDRLTSLLSESQQ